MKSSKVIILTRVIQSWRAPIFEKLALNENLDIEFWHGPDFKGTKVVSKNQILNLRNKKLFSFKIQFNTRNGVVAIPVSPLLFIKLVYKQPDVIVSEGASNLFNAFIGFIYCKLFKKKFVWWSLGKVVNRNYDISRKILDRLIIYIERNCHKILTYSSEGKKYFNSIGVQNDQIVVAVNVIDTELKLREISRRKVPNEILLEFQKFSFKILFVGALTKEKDVDKLLLAQKKMENLNYNIVTIIVGDGPYKDNLRKLSSDLDIKNISFIDGTFDDSFNYFSIADLFVLPGLGGLAISEAMCYGLPVITSVGDGCEVDLVTHENGIVDKFMTTEKLTSYILKFYHNRNLRDSCGLSSKNIILNKYNSSNYINKILEVILS